MTVPVEQCYFKVASGSTYSTNAPTARYMQDHLGDVLNVKSYGAVGDGATDDTTAIQACFTAAFGSSAAPHGSSAAYLNKAVFFPPGQYKITQLRLTDVYGAHIYGSGIQATELVSTARIAFQTDGMSNCQFNDWTVHTTAATTSAIAFDLDWSGTSTSVGLGNNLFLNWSPGCFSQSGTTGMRIGHSGNGGDANQFLKCTGGAQVAMLVEHGLANLIQGGGWGNNIVVQCTGGSVQVESVSVDSPSSTNFIISSTSPCVIQGVRTESSATFLTAGSDSRVTCYAVNASVGVATIATLGSSAAVIFDVCTMAGDITSATTSPKLYLRGNQFPSSSLLTGYTGNVPQNI